MELEKTVIAEWLKKYDDFVVVRKLKSGKEADVWLVRADRRLCALKIYTEQSFSSRAAYTEGQWQREVSLRKAVRQKTKLGRELQQRLWTKREYYLLKKLHATGAHMPEAITHTDTAILMQYLGDESTAAPRLIDVTLDSAIKPQVLAMIEASIKLFLEAGIVHADLSPYNILWWQDQPWIIDFPQAVDTRHNPNWRALYERDLRNIRDYFA